MVYIYVFILTTFFTYLASRTKNKGLLFLYSAISILIPSIVGGLRAYGVGGDTTLYGRNDFLAVLKARDMYRFVFRNPEIGYNLLIYAISRVVDSENWAYFAYQIITITCIYIGAYKHKDKISMTLIMFVWMILNYCESYNAMRQTIACSIIFMNMDKLENKQYWKFALTIIAATTFHTSALVAFVLLLGMHIVTTSEALERNMWLKFIVMYGSLLSFFALIPIIIMLVNSLEVLSKYRAYLHGMGYLRAHRSSMMLFLGQIVMIFLYHKRASRIFTNNGVKNLEFYTYSILFCAAFMLAVSSIAHRVLRYPQHAQILVLAALPKFIKEKHLRFLVTIAVSSAVVFYLWYTTVVWGNSDVLPYRSIL